MKNKVLTNEALEKLLLEYMPKSNMVLGQLEEERDKDLVPHVFSKRYKRNIKKIIKEHSSTPVQKKLINLRKYAATILIIFILMNGILIATAQGYREIVFKIITNTYEKFTSIIIDVEESVDREDIELNFIEPPYIPDGFQVIEDIQTDIGRKIYYMKDNELIMFKQSIITSGQIKLDTEGTVVKKMQINNQTVRYYFNKNIYNAYWVDEIYEYSIVSEVSFQELTKIIKGIIKK